ncbi:hypothetical protein I3271_04485 [Photobacterium leiognathi]|uniref:hypothetical protein n=1 Tax=Photobacterium leiognathi TaxID=553611 RepID=UPI001EE012B7|nr:hypothetical protein [Photobacterium leiognathi]MCG3883941.1 hypothetical protein [Photobacterium leiognathi]
MVILKPTSEDNPDLWGIEFKKQGEAYIDAQKLSYVGHWKVDRVGDEVMGYDVLQISGLDSINEMSLMIVESSNDVYVSADLQQSGRYLLLSGDRDLNYILGSKVVSF